MSKISKVIARQVFDSRGNPTIETEVFVKDISASAICPSGASTGTYEAFEKRDIKNKKYLGKSVLKPVEFINKVISNKLKNFNVHQQEKIDNLLIRLDGTKQKKRVGANAILSVSIAVKKLSSKIKKIPIYKNLLINKNFKLPYPLMNIINGGAHANNGLRIQEFMIRPVGASNFKEIMNIGPHKLLETDVSAHNPFDSETFRRGGTGLFSTSEDYLSFARMLLSGKSKSGETLLSRNMVEFMKINRIPNTQLPWQFYFQNLFF